MNLKIKRVFFFVLLALLLLNAYIVQAADLRDAFRSNLWSVAGQAGYNPAVNAPQPIISAVVNVALSVLGVIFLFLIIYGGYMWMTARGNEQQVEKAKNTIQTAIIGLIIVLAAYAISWYVVSKIGAGMIEAVDEGMVPTDPTGL